MNAKDSSPDVTTWVAIIILDSESIPKVVGYSHFLVRLTFLQYCIHESIFFTKAAN